MSYIVFDIGLLLRESSDKILSFLFWIHDCSKVQHRSLEGILRWVKMPQKGFFQLKTRVKEVIVSKNGPGERIYQTAVMTTHCYRF